jgi:hypothetical protein
MKKVACKIMSKTRLTIPIKVIREFIIEHFEGVPKDAQFLIDKLDGSISFDCIDRVRVVWEEEEEFYVE